MEPCPRDSQSIQRHKSLQRWALSAEAAKYTSGCGGRMLKSRGEGSAGQNKTRC